MDINERAKQIKAEQEAAKKAADPERAAEPLKQQEAAHHAKEVRRLLNHFLGWAERHHISHDYTHKVSVLRRINGWKVASRSYEVDGPYDSVGYRTDEFALTNKGELVSSPGGESVTNYSVVTISSIEDHIARFVAKHNIPWDN